MSIILKHVTSVCWWETGYQEVIKCHVVCRSHPKQRRPSSLKMGVPRLRFVSLMRKRFCFCLFVCLFFAGITFWAWWIISVYILAEDTMFKLFTYLFQQCQEDENKCYPISNNTGCKLYYYKEMNSVIKSALKYQSTAANLLSNI